MSEGKQLYGADLVVDSLINHDVKYVFGIPGAKIDRVFDTLEDKGPELIVARHEQNAAFMAQGVGRITGKPGVVLVTSGPGVSNLATGLVTATDEGDPVLAIGGQVKRADLLKRAHQSMNNVAMLEPITKYAAEVHDANTLSEIVANAYRHAKAGKPGASFISIPQDVTDAPVSVKAIKPLTDPKETVFIANVTFEPACRNNWHIHHAKSGGGQILICVDGEGWYQEEGKEAQSLKPGDTITIPANVKHWHGAKKDRWFSHLAIEVPGVETSNEWLEPVKNEFYDSLKEC